MGPKKYLEYVRKCKRYPESDYIRGYLYGLYRHYNYAEKVARNKRLQDMLESRTLESLGAIDGIKGKSPCVGILKIPCS
jgi:hypothetical protein